MNAPTRLLQQPHIELHVTLRLNESEIRALDALAGYGADSFLKVFYAHMGEHYMRPHEAGLRSLFQVVQAELPPILNRQNSAKKAFALRDPIVRSRAEYNETIERLTKAKTP